MERYLNSTDYDMRQYINKINTLLKKLAQINQEILTGYAQTYARVGTIKTYLTRGTATLESYQSS